MIFTYEINRDQRALKRQACHSIQRHVFRLYHPVLWNRVPPIYRLIYRVFDARV